MSLIQPFDPELSEDGLQRAFACRPLKSLDVEDFPPHLSLQYIIRLHGRIRRYSHGALLVREGDYGSSAFIILQGSAKVVIAPSLPDNLLGKRTPSGQKNKKLRDYFCINANKKRTQAGETNLDTPLKIQGQGANAQSIIGDPDKILADSRTAIISQDELFGEIAAMARVPRTASVLAYCDSDDPSEADDIELLEIRWQGLRLIRHYSSSFREHTDQVFRERYLKQQLMRFEFFQNIDDQLIEKLLTQSRFESIGKIHPDTAEETEPNTEIMLNPGDKIDAFRIVQTGYIQVLDEKGVTINFYRQGDHFGLSEIQAAWKNSQDLSQIRQLRAVGEVDLISIPVTLMFEAFNQNVSAQPQFERSDRTLEYQDFSGSNLIQLFLKNRFSNGQAIMLIDLNRCTRCDDCVVACSRTHGGVPRFVRNGPRSDQYMVAHACMHCVSPDCLVGCPTGAISRNTIGGTVTINEATCIGCGTCEQACTYNNINMIVVEHSLEDGQIDNPVKASNCDLCANKSGGPSCEKACAYDALRRFDAKDLKKIGDWMQ